MRRPVVLSVLARRRGGGKKKREGRKEEWQRRQQVIDGVNAWIEIQTVMHSYQLAVKKRDWLPAGAREREKEREGWQKDGEVVPDSSRSHSVYRESFSGEGEPFSCNQGCVICMHHVAGERSLETNPRYQGSVKHQGKSCSHLGVKFKW